MKTSDTEKQLRITQNKAGRFDCIQEGSCGSYVVGRGASVLEAVGSWAIYSRTVKITCEPPVVMQGFTIATGYIDLEFEPPDKRS